MFHHCYYLEIFWYVICYINELVTVTVSPLMQIGCGNAYLLVCLQTNMCSPSSCSVWSTSSWMKTSRDFRLLSATTVSPPPSDDLHSSSWFALCLCAFAFWATDRETARICTCIDIEWSYMKPFLRRLDIRVPYYVPKRIKDGLEDSPVPQNANSFIHTFSLRTGPEECFLSSPSPVAILCIVNSHFFPCQI